MGFLPTSKIRNLIKIMKHCGGPVKMLGRIWRMDAAKHGKYMGSDVFCNRYYENNMFMLGRNRWVEYADYIKWEYDGSQVPPEWHGWLHHKTDLLPKDDPAKQMISKCPSYHCWILPPMENMTKTPFQYMPYPTIRPYIYVWDGGSIVHRPCYPLPEKKKLGPC